MVDVRVTSRDVGPRTVVDVEGEIDVSSADALRDQLASLLDRAPEHTGRELPSEGLVPGAVQVPPDGQPVVFGVDHPVTGGYPVVAVVRRSAHGLLGQVRPGDRVFFVRG